MADYLTVSALTSYLKRKFTADPYLKEVYVTGEISNYRQRPGHQYFSLKDDGAVLNATMFKFAFQKLQFKLEPGMKVNAVGHMDLYAPNGSYSLIIDKLEPDGVGALYQAYEQLKAKLAEEGLFNQLQRPIPRFPKKIAVITSPSGAVIRDIMTTVQRRYPIAEIVLYPAVVQGDGAVPSLTAQMTAVAESGDYDVLIMGRGGGSIEDLWAFNEEAVARQMLTMPMPIISSVGHETDTTIADFIADQRAATPTAAAELATPVPLADLWLGIQQMQQRLVNQMQRQVVNSQERLQRLQNSYVLTQPARLYEGYLQRLDIAQQRLQQSVVTLVTQRRHQFDLIAPRLTNAMTRQTENAEQRVGKAVAGLQLVSPLAILARGYSVVEQDGHILNSVADVTLQEDVLIRLADGQVTATVTKKEETE
ncbi:exodeoxyribonuclease VII large subunit [Weissella confusa]|jgi:exodeoxyribonuclease VII large subunit|uniref:Exodeoxyribonuclease 7 large subunit n=2 Tax=Weissella confusa TaxID=1583 RepID=A0A0R2F7F9_WEICO|nr:exodeoxyribonuclease VII large subunit [Weissella confusa]KRN23606.1 exodeoxyribonuclease VII large subunit [Weissella confusa]MBD1492001.1 exodeoxyribonuclease VII large subunit [Weissella confusa]MBD5834087.1 exodeoxyribonuclease VII large subunit [Weissella confusa]MBF7058471.1 exodeoxyribonuclease VII large subunit [Weissella confusa]MBJ7616167.1 exodeoxyribonuclease VII large subunit [Weissella confusa]